MENYPNKHYNKPQQTNKQTNNNNNNHSIFLLETSVLEVLFPIIIIDRTRIHCPQYHADIIIIIIIMIFITRWEMTRRNYFHYFQ